VLRSMDSELRVLVVHANMADEESVVVGMNKIIQTFGRIDYAINNAGVGGKLGPTTVLTASEFRSTIDINLIGLWVCQREEIKQMMKQEPLPHRYICRSIGGGQEDALTQWKLGHAESWSHCEYVIDARTCWHMCRNSRSSILC
jgi:NAD(P)-dependent dehydrogenase (short-subunit alcohol dehydrogenase family)